MPQSPQNLYAEILTSKMMVLEGELLESNYVIGLALP